MLLQILICLLILCLAYLFFSYWRLRHVPGPVLASFSKLWLLRCAVRAELHIGLLEACEQYGLARSRLVAKLNTLADPAFSTKAISSALAQMRLSQMTLR